MKRLLATGVVVLLTLGGCGGAKNKLTEEQKKNFAELIESTGRTQTAARQAQPNSARTIRRSTSLPADQKMVDKLRGGQCRFRVSEPPAFDEAGPFSSGPLEQGFAVEGNSCPINLSFSVKSLLTETDFTVSLDMKYAVNDSEYKTLNDVYGFELKGEARANRNGGNGDFAGVIRSQKYGNVPTRISLSGTQDQMEWTYSWEMASAPVEIKVVQKSSGALEITRNGESLTKDEFTALMQKGGDAYASVTPEASDARRRTAE